MTTLNPKSGKAVEHAVNACIEFALNEGTRSSRNDPTRVNFLRVSSFPFCARSWFLSLQISRATRRNSNAFSDYYTSVGTTVHTVFQHALDSLHQTVHDEDIKRLPSQAVLVQDWKCLNCSARYEYQPKPHQCKWCACPFFHGEEHELTFSKHILGHMDGSFAYPLADGKPYSKRWIHIPIDYKTTTESAIKGSALPYSDNVDQLSSYGAIKAAQGFNIPGTCLIYVCRDNPRKRKTIFTPLDFDAQMKKIERYERAYALARKCTTLEEAIELPVRARKDFEKHCGYCRFQGLCSQEASGNQRPLRDQATRVVTWLAKKGNRSDFPNV